MHTSTEDMSAQINLYIFRREIVQYSLRLILDSFQTLLSHTYISVTFLMMCAAMWSFNIQFDTRFFAIASCMLGYMRLSVVDFFHYAIRYLVNYIAAQKRIQVSLWEISRMIKLSLLGISST